MSTIPTLAALWARAVDRRGDSPFLIFEAPGDEVSEWTYSEFDAIVARTSRLLVDNSVSQGDAVQLVLTNSPMFIATWLAAVSLGAWIVPSDPMARTPELRDHVDRTAPAFGICSVDREPIYRAAVAASAVTMRYLAVNEADALMKYLPRDPLTEFPEPAPMDRAAVMFTSGTTGRPKGVEVTQANYGFVGEVMAYEAGLSEKDRQLVVLPMFHANAQYYSFASAIVAGASVALMHTFSASRFLSQAQRHEATCASLFAAPLRMILARGRPVDGLMLRHCWFAQNISPDDYTRVTDWFGCSPRQIYGMTETIAAVLTSPVGDATPASMGSVTHRCAVELHDDQGNRVDPGVEGEIVVSGVPGGSLFAGYLDDVATTEASFDGEWFLTGDRAIADEHGRFYFSGRRSDVLKVAGENVSTVEIEQVLSEHRSVLEAAVVGAPDEIRDEVPVAFVVAAAPDSGIDVVDLESWCRDRLGKMKQPRTITVVDSLPRTSVGKIRKFLLRESPQTFVPSKDDDNGTPRTVSGVTKEVIR